MALIAAAAVLVACGDDEPTGPPDESDAAEIAALINETEDALLARDATAVCAGLTERGQQIMIRIGRQAGFGADPENCEEGVDAFLERTSDSKLKLLEDREFTTADVDVDPTDDAGYNGLTDSAEELEDAERIEIQVPCGGSGNAYFAIREEGDWKLLVPFCTGR